MLKYRGMSLKSTKYEGIEYQAITKKKITSRMYVYIIDYNKKTQYQNVYNAWDTIIIANSKRIQNKSLIKNEFYFVQSFGTFGLLTPHH